MSMNPSSPSVTQQVWVPAGPCSHPSTSLPSGVLGNILGPLEAGGQDGIRGTNCSSCASGVGAAEPWRRRPNPASFPPSSQTFQAGLRARREAEQDRAPRARPRPLTTPPCTGRPRPPPRGPRPSALPTAWDPAVRCPLGSAQQLRLRHGRHGLPLAGTHHVRRSAAAIGWTGGGDGATGPGECPRARPLCGWWVSP